MRKIILIGLGIICTAVIFYWFAMREEPQKLALPSAATPAPLLTPTVQNITVVSAEEKAVIDDRFARLYQREKKLQIVAEREGKPFELVPPVPLKK